jgi:hypothetical protein
MENDHLLYTDGIFHETYEKFLKDSDRFFLSFDATTLRDISEEVRRKEALARATERKNNYCRDIPYGEMNSTQQAMWVFIEVSGHASRIRKIADTRARSGCTTASYKWFGKNGVPDSLILSSLVGSLKRMGFHVRDHAFPEYEAGEYDEPESTVETGYAWYSIEFSWVENENAFL